MPVPLDHFYDMQLIYSHALAGISACLAVGGALLLPLPPYRYDADSRAAAAMHV